MLTYIIHLRTITLKYSSPLDPLFNYFIVGIIFPITSFLTPFILTVIKNYLRTGKIPDVLKHAVVIPLIKNHNLDKEILTNYRPISQLPFISKIIEKMVA